MSWTLRVLVAAVLSCLAASAAAQGGKPHSPVTLDGVQILGTGTPTHPGWFSCSLRVTNASSEPAEGTVELISKHLAWSSDSSHFQTRAPFAVPPGGSVVLQLPTHGFYESPPALRAEARDSSGNLIVGIDLPDPRPADPLLFSLAIPTRVTPWLRGHPLQLAARHGSHGGYDLPTLDVGTAQVQAASGELILPERAAGYSSATLVLAPSMALSRASDPQRQALADWVLSGGALAIAISRPEDLRSPLLKSLVGGSPEPTGAPSVLRAPRAFIVAPETPGSRAPTRKLASPSTTVAPTLIGYDGGNLRASPWGAAATYGLGEVHLLGFDPTVEEVANDPWVHLQLQDLIRHAWNRKLHIALPHGETALDTHETREIRRLLDPNESSRWSIAVATLILLLYSVLAGPLSFHLAARRQQPLRALWQLPIWSLLTFAIIVGLGVLAKGLSGEARHVALVEVGAGMNRGTVTRFRAFYSPASSKLAISAAEYGNVLDLAGPDQASERVLVVDRDGARLEGFRAKPWQTVLVREDGFTRVGEGVSLVAAGRDLMIKNRTGRDLVGVLVRTPENATRFFARVPDGASVAASSGEAISGLGSTRGFGVGMVFKQLNETEPKLGEVWQALQTYCDHNTIWWPEGVPTLIAQLAGGEGAQQDSQLKLTEDRVLVRVVGFGGRP